MNKHGDSRAGGNREQQTFREWLLVQLKLSRWSVTEREEVADAARRLGVQEDLLQQAISERASGKKLHTRRELAEQRQLKMWVPQEVSLDWLEYCKLLGVTGATLLRGIVQRYLVQPVTTPAMLDRRWFYRGKRYSTKADSRVHVMSRVSRGAMQAIDHHARELRVPTAWVLKGLVVDLLEGRTKQVKFLLPGEMWGDPKRYLQPELFR